MARAKVYFTKEVTPESIVKMYEAVGRELPGKVAVKLHSGEKGNKNYLRPELVQPMVERVKGTVVECNTAYGDAFKNGVRDHTESHLQLMKEHGWSEYFEVDLMDAEGPDLELEIPDGKVIKKNYVGKDLENYDSLLVLSHFKGHLMGGYGGALKQLAIGCASRAGKAWIHSAGRTTDRFDAWKDPDQDKFLESMADAASSIVKHFGENVVFINVMKNISVDCDCDGNASAPCMADMGVLASTDPVAVDQACLDLVYKSDDPGRDALVERIESRHGVHTIEAADALGFGTREYELAEVK